MAYKNNIEIRLGNLFGATGGNYAGMVYNKIGISSTLNTAQGGYRMPMIVVKINDKSK